MKKSQLHFFFLILFSCPLYPQFTAESFETWEAGSPVNWFTSNLANIYVPVTQTNDAHSGSSAVRGETIQIPNGTGYPPILSAGSDAHGFPINFRPQAVNGWYKFHSDSGDAFSVSVVVIKNNKAIGSGGYYDIENSSVYKQFSANITYLTAETPDTIQIVILIANSTVKIGASFVLDDVSLGSPTSISGSNTQYVYSLTQNFPNPFNPLTNIQFSIPDNELVRLKVFNSVGQEIAVLVNESLSPGFYKYDFDAGNLPSGVYYYQLQAGSFIQSRKMLVLK